MSEQMDKLVEEMAREIFFLEPYDGRDWNKAVARARRIITHIGKAYADGLPLPREVGRHDPRLADTTLLTWILRMNESGATEFIALSLEEDKE